MTDKGNKLETGLRVVEGGSEISLREKRKISQGIKIASKLMRSIDEKISSGYLLYQHQDDNHIYLCPDKKDRE